MGALPVIESNKKFHCAFSKNPSTVALEVQAKLQGICDAKVLLDISESNVTAKFQLQAFISINNLLYPFIYRIMQTQSEWL